MNRKLSDEEEVEIILLHRIGLKPGVIAAAYHVSRQTVSRLSGNDQNLGMEQMRRSLNIPFDWTAVYDGITKVVTYWGMDK